MSDIPVGYEGQLAELGAIAARRAADFGREVRILAALVAECPPWLDEEHAELALEKQWVREEISCALGLPAAWVSSMIAEAVYLVEVLPGAVDRLESGEISRSHCGRWSRRWVAARRRWLPRSPSECCRVRGSRRREFPSLDCQGDRDRGPGR